jgi:hypothetical protein
MILIENVHFHMGFTSKLLLNTQIIGIYLKLQVFSEEYFRNSFIICLLTLKKSVSFLYQDRSRIFLKELLKIMFHKPNPRDWAQIISTDVRWQYLEDCNTQEEQCGRVSSHEGRVEWCNGELNLCKGPRNKASRSLSRTLCQQLNQNLQPGLSP